MSKIVLYGVDLSPPVRAVLLTLKALELPYEYKEVNLGTENRTPEYLKKNPQGTVPLLDDNDTYIFDSHAICSYLCDKYGKTDSLYPKDLVKRSAVNQRMFFDASVIYMSLWNCSSVFWRKGVTFVSKEKTDNIHEALRLTETFLDEKPYIAGDELTIADFCCAATVSSIPAVLDIDPVKYPKVTAWLARLNELPYFEEANNVGNTKKAKFWSLLAEKVNTYGGLHSSTPVTKEALQKKWTNMKTYYLFEESKSRRIGAETDSFSTTWKFRSTLSFLGTSLGASPRPQPNTSGTNAECSTVLAHNASESSFDLSEDDPLATQEGLPANITIKTEEPPAEESSTEIPSILHDNEIEEEEEVEPPLPPVRKRAKEYSIGEGRLHRTNFYHYGMTVAQDLDQLDEDYKIDAKLEIMQIIAKYKREQYLNQT
ncbi:hypothetical protein ACLKA6_018278 [Drosophila palustris]